MARYEKKGANGRLMTKRTVDLSGASTRSMIDQLERQGDAVFSSSIRSNEYFTSSATSSRPWCHTTPFRSLNTNDVSLTTCQDSARSPTMFIFGSRRSRVE